MLKLKIEKEELKLEPFCSHYVHFSVSKGNVDLVRYWVDNHALKKENLQNNEWSTPVHTAIENNDVKMTEYLLTTRDLSIISDFSCAH
ncbi:MAG: ankyrin repeat domain-containing protein [Endozoicomonadaceae bacterium]|nr:ankyrin repeat domain-containing protein [Endozoicomonadaceae bacterium]